MTEKLFSSKRSCSFIEFNLRQIIYVKSKKKVIIRILICGGCYVQIRLGLCVCASGQQNISVTFLSPVIELHDCQNFGQEAKIISASISNHCNTVVKTAYI